MNQYRNDDELITLLKETFPTNAERPDERARELLLDALSADNVVPFDHAAGGERHLRRRLGSRASAVTLSAIGVLALGGVAAAAVATNTLPGPTRAIAYDLGLPVTSPALYQARTHLHQLTAANARHETSAARDLSRVLIHDLSLLNHRDLSQIRSAAHHALSVSGLLSQATQILGITTPTPPATTTTMAPSTSTTTTTVLVPLSVPGVGSVSSATGSTSMNGVLKNLTSPVTSLLP